MIIIFILLAVLLGYSIYLTVIAHKLKKKHFVHQVRQFIINIRLLGLSDADIIDLLTKYNSYEELVEANRKLRNSIKKYKL